MSDVLARIAARLEGTTHYEGCEEDHLLCAAEQEIKRLRRKATRRKRALREANRATTSWKRLFEKADLHRAYFQSGKAGKEIERLRARVEAAQEVVGAAESVEWSVGGADDDERQCLFELIDALRAYRAAKGEEPER